MQNLSPTTLLSKTSRLATCVFLLGGSIGTVALPSRSALAQRTRSNPDSDILVTARPEAHAAMPSVVIDKVVNIIGLEGAKENGMGRLTITEHEVVFLTDQTISMVPVSAISSVAMDHTSKPLFRGIGGPLRGSHRTAVAKSMVRYGQARRC